MKIKLPEPVDWPEYNSVYRSWREGCYCFNYRKPCEYHEGYEDARSEMEDDE